MDNYLKTDSVVVLKKTSFISNDETAPLTLFQGCEGVDPAGEGRGAAARTVPPGTTQSPTTTVLVGQQRVPCRKGDKGSQLVS